MEHSDYRAGLRAVLDTASPQVALTLQTLADAAVTEQVDGILIDVFLDQDGSGAFDVWARFDGRDVSALDQRLADVRALFGVEWGEDGWDPDVPPRPRMWTHGELEAAIVETVAAWLDPLVPSGGPDVVWEVSTPEGTVDPILLAAQE